MRTAVFIAHLFVVASSGWGQSQLASPVFLSNYKQMLPNIGDSELAEIVENPRTIWYTTAEMPRAYQFDVRRDGQMGAHSASFNVAPKRGDPLPNGGFIQQDFDLHGNGNQEWPWDHPAVLDNSDSRVKNLIGFRLPGKPVVYYDKRYASRLKSGKTDSFFRRGIGWTFPLGTEFVEIISTMVDQRDYAFVIFRMQKAEDGWVRYVYRQFPTEASYEQTTGRDLSGAERATFSLRNPHPTTVFNRTREVVYLPVQRSDVVAAILSKFPFVLCDQTDDFIPTTREDDQLVPRQYIGRFIGNGGSDCLACHAQVGEDVSTVELNRDWYGLFRGSDEIFSWHPFDPVCISTNGTHTRMMLRRGWEQEGIVERYDSTKHVPPEYVVR